jgi:hypothetical protein
MPALAIGAPPCANLTPQSGELGYQQRGDRCEGIFVQDIRSNVRLKSVLAPLESASSPVEKELQLMLLPDTPPAQYQLRVTSLDPRVHYQLDAFIPDGGVFNWPETDVVSRIPIKLSDLAPLTWSVSEPVYFVPVLFSAATARTQDFDSKAVYVIIESTVPIQQYSARLIYEKSGELKQLTALSVLPATQIELALPSHNSSGYYTLWLRVRLLGESQPEGQSWTFWLP